MHLKNRPSWLLRFWLGLAVGLNLALLVTSGVFLRPVPAQAVTPSCFLKAECIDLNKANGGNCDNEHCWEPGGNCGGTAGNCYAKWPEQNLSVNIGVTTVSNLGDYLLKIYDAAFAMAGFLAAVMMIIGGIYYVSASGNDSKLGKGKTMIKNALVGLFIAAGAYVILMTVNPDLIRLKLPKILVVKKQRLGQCKGIEMCVPCGQKFVALLPKSAKDDLGGGLTGGVAGVDCDDPSVKGRIMKFGEKMTDAQAAKYDEGPECVGKSCGLADPWCKDNSHKCVIKPKGAQVPHGCSKVQGGPGQVACMPVPGAPASVQEVFVDAGTPCPANTKLHEEATGPAPSDNNEYYCKECIANGQSGCTVVNGVSDECCSGFCTTSGGKVQNVTGNTPLGVCSTGEFGEPCSDDSQCASKLCNQGWFSGRCVTGLVGSPCAEPADCAKGNYCDTWSHLCLPGNEYNYCNDSSNCKNGLQCRQLEGLWSGTTSVAGSLANFASQPFCLLPDSVLPDVVVKLCAAGKQGATGLANAAMNGKFKMCAKDGAELTTCGVCSLVNDLGSVNCSGYNIGCMAAVGLVQSLSSGLNCSQSNNEGCPASAPQCSAAAGRACISGEVGAPCSEDQDCNNLRCGGCTSTSCAKVCSTGELGTACDEDSDCASHHCVCNTTGLLSNICACVAGSVGSPCNENKDCGKVPDGSGKDLICKDKSCITPEVSDGL